MTDHEIYARNLLSGKGFAPYYPCPVNIPEVGYVFDGGWQPLFDASKKPGDESNTRGVPNGYRPLDVGELKTRVLSNLFPITNEQGTGLGFGFRGSSAPIPSVMSADGQYTFTSSRQEGAILVPDKIIDTADAVERLRYITYIRENSASWLDFANKRHGRGIRLIDLVLVTGWHKTAFWGCAAFSQCSREITLTFNVGVGATQGGVWGKWSDMVSPRVWGHSGPPMASLKAGQPSTPQNDKSPMDVDNSGKKAKRKRKKTKLPARSEQMEGAYQHCSADVQALGTDSTNIRDQGIFIRGYKFCDRHTGLARIFYRKHEKDGFTVIHPRNHDEVGDGCSIDGNHNQGDEDGDRDGDPSSSRRDCPSRGPGNSSSSPWSSSSGSQDEPMGQSSDGNSGPSSSSHRDNLAYDFKLDDDLVQYLQLNGGKEPTAVEIILEYILENSTAEFSLAHDDDVTESLQDEFGAKEFAVEIRKISPQIFVVDQVGMLFRTYMASLGSLPGKGHVAQEMPSTMAYLAPTNPNAFEPTSLPSSHASSPSLLSPTAPISHLLPEVTGTASDQNIVIDGEAPPQVHPVLSAESNVVRYDFGAQRGMPGVSFIRRWLTRDTYSPSTPLFDPISPPPLLSSCPLSPRVHHVLSESTMVRYDFTRNPRTIRMLSSSQYRSFPSDAPASIPSESMLHVRCEATGHMITVHTHDHSPVTCLDLMVQLHRFFQGNLGGEEWQGVRGAKKSAMKEAYRRRTGRAYSASARMKRIDYFLGQTTFKRIVPGHEDLTLLLETY